MYAALLIVFRAGRSQDEGIIEVKVVVFKLIVMTMARKLFYLWSKFAVAEG